MSVFSGHYEIEPDDLVAHIRWGDMVVFDLAMSLSFYSNLLQRLEFGRLFVCGCGISEEVREALAPFSPIYVQGTPADDFRFMLGFYRIIQSNCGLCLVGWLPVHGERNLLPGHGPKRTDGAPQNDHE